MKTIFAAAALLSAIAAPAFAGSDSTLLTANVPVDCTIDSPADQVITLGSATQGLGNVVAKCNSSTGFTATISSQNAGYLVDSSSSTNPNKYNYTVSIPGALNAVQLTNAFSINSASVGQNAALLTAQTFGVSVQVGAGTGPAYAGNYQDRLIFTLNAN